MESKQRFIDEAVQAMHAGAKRDDVYHECSKFAVLNNLNRYDLWVAIVTSSNGFERVASD